MPYHFWLVLSGLWIMIIALARWNRTRSTVDYQSKMNELREKINEAKPKPHKIRFYGGPLDEKEDQVIHDSPFGFIEYVPEEDEDRIQIGEVMGQPIYQPKIAYYRMVTPGDYFYVRDVTPAEAQKAARTGVQPDVTVQDKPNN